MDNLGWRKKARAVLLIGTKLTMVLAILARIGFAQHLESFSFLGPNGAAPRTDLVADAVGNLYGVAPSGGLFQDCPNYNGCGLVFEFSPPTQPGGTWTETTLYAFQGSSDGYMPYGPLTIDKAGNLYGVTAAGGVESGGTMFELSPPPQPGGAWNETVLYNFNCFVSGCEPTGGLVPDAAGDLYGINGAGDRGGTAFELSPPSEPGGAWTETTLYTFGASQYDGVNPQGSVIFGPFGDLYGVTVEGGTSGSQGTVFQLTPPSQPGGAWTEAILHNFGSIPNDGAYPQAHLAFTPLGALIGTAPGGGESNGGVVFGLLPPSTPGGTWQYGVVYNFGAKSGDGANPLAGLTPQGGHSFYGTTLNGGTFNHGTVFQLTPPSSPGGAWTETVLYSFGGGKDGCKPVGGVTVEGYALYGTAYSCGTEGVGTAYRLSH